MNNKRYYTPTIEEFHVGFEYECQDISGTGLVWVKQIHDGEELRTYITDELKETNIRVKYLDKEDIEDLGFVLRIGITPRTTKFTLAGYTLLFNNETCRIRISRLATDGETKIYKLGSSIYLICDCIIRNKSELKRLLKQLNIL